MKALGLLEVDEAKLIANYKACFDVFNGSKLIITEKELKDWHLNSIGNPVTEPYEEQSRGKE